MAKEAMNKLSEKMEEVESLVKSPDLFIYEHFKKIRNEIDLKTETMIKEIEDQREEYIKKLKVLEEECKIKLQETETKEHLNELILSIQKNFDQLNQRVNKLFLSSSSDEIKVKEEILKLEKELSKTQKYLLKNHKCQFTPNTKETTIGKLTIREVNNEKTRFKQINNIIFL